MKPNTSPKKIAANRRNAQLSTGPRTDNGKHRSALNAVKHGVFSQTLLLPHLHETEEQFQTFRQTLLDALAPPTALHALFAEEFILDQWRLRRIRAAEHGCLHNAAHLGHDEYITFHNGEVFNRWKNPQFDTPQNRHRAFAVTLAQQTSHHDFWTRLSRIEDRLRRSARQTLQTFYALPVPDPETDPEPPHPEPAEPATSVQNEPTSPVKSTPPPIPFPAAAKTEVPSSSFVREPESRQVTSVPAENLIK
jgi:hypothetical protein